MENAGEQVESDERMGETPPSNVIQRLELAIAKRIFPVPNAPDKTAIELRIDLGI